MGNLVVGPPWPQDLRTENGGLPEYVVTKEVDGRLTWAAPGLADKFPLVGRYRARVDIELVVDGKIIDLNRIQLPPDTPIVDKRFPAPVLRD